MGYIGQSEFYDIRLVFLGPNKQDQIKYEFNCDFFTHDNVLGIVKFTRYMLNSL